MPRISYDPYKFLPSAQSKQSPLTVTLGGVTFIKGQTREVTPEQLKRAERVNSPYFQLMVVEEDPETPEDPDPQEQEEPNLSDLKAQEAIALVNETTDPGKLGVWFEGETRVSVTRAIEERLDELTRPSPPSPAE